MTIEEIVGIARRFAYGSRMEWPEPELRAALTALVAQARDEEAAACIGIIVGANNYDNPLTGNDCIDMIRTRIAARKQVEPECEMCEGKGTIDERLTGWSDDNPKAKCPDCDGAGWTAARKGGNDD